MRTFDSGDEGNLDRKEILEENKGLKINQLDKSVGERGQKNENQRKG